MRFSWLLLGLLLPGCQPARGPDQDPNDPESRKMCAAAQARLSSFPGCFYARLPGGKSFEQFCLEKRATDPPALSMAGVKCLATVGSCDDKEVEACHAR